VTAALCERWQPGVELLPMTDDRVETHVVIEDPNDEGRRRAVHFQEYWVRLHAPTAYAVTLVGIDEAHPAPGVLDAISGSDVLIVPPSNPVVSVGTILGVAGITEAIKATSATVVGVSPIIAGAPVRGMADKLLPVIGVEVSAAAVGAHYGARANGGLLDGWLVDNSDAPEVPRLQELGLAARAVPLFMSDDSLTAELARATLDLASDLQHA
jgi:LPPG:FO 2-phospho-L-lactate transferase